jgi:hypothetical protein
MFGFLHRSGPSKTVVAIQRAIAGSGLPTELDPAKLSVVESRGSYAGRTVTHFRVVDPRQTAGQSGKQLRYKDLDAREELVLRSGHVEADGTVVLNRVLTDEGAAPGFRARPQRPGTYAGGPDGASERHPLRRLGPRTLVAGEVTGAASLG